MDLFHICNETHIKAEVAKVIVIRVNNVAKETLTGRVFFIIVCRRRSIITKVVNSVHKEAFAVTRSRKTNGSGCLHCRPFYSSFFVVLCCICKCIEGNQTCIPIVRKQDHTIFFSADSDAIFVFAATSIIIIICPSVFTSVIAEKILPFLC